MKNYNKDKVDHRRFLQQTSQAIVGRMVFINSGLCPVDEGETSAVTEPTKTDGTLAKETALGTKRI